MLWDTAARVGDRAAVSERGATTTYAALVARAAAIGRALQAAGVGPGDRAAVFLERGADAAAAFFGALAAGAVVVNVNETLRPLQVEHVLRHAGARALVTTGRLLTRQPRPLDAEATPLLVETLPPAASLEPVERVGSDVAELIYTSGSTGLPKGVTLSHANLWAGTRAVIGYLGITSADRIASLLPFSFDYGCNPLLCAVATGATLVVERSSVPQHVAAALRASAVTVLAAVPPLWLQLLTAADFRSPLPALRTMTNTGGSLPSDAVRALRQAQPHARLFLMYGLTEALRCTYLPPEEVDRRPDSIGRAIPGAEVIVLDDELTLCGPGEVGELVYRGPTVTLGYWNDPEATARVFRPNPLRAPAVADTERVVFTGDLVRRDDAGFLYYVGRRDRMIKTLGYRVSPDEIAEAIYASGEVTDCVIGAAPDDIRGQRIAAHVVLVGGGSLERLRRHCGIELPRYMQPTRFELRDTLPRLPNGKHDVAALGALPDR